MTKKKPVIAVDIDDVMAQSAKELIKHSNDRYGADLTIDDYDEDWAKLWQVDFEVMRQRVVEYFETNVISNYDHIDGAYESLQLLKKDYDLIIITSRNTRDTKDDTLIWMNKKFPGIFEEECIHFAGIWDKVIDHRTIHETKGDMCKRLDVDYIIDDQVKHCNGAAEHGIKALLFGDYNWNRHDEIVDNVTRVSNWAEILEYFNAEKQSN